MFAGAAREAVFSKREVIDRINADFIPVALKAALVNNPPDDDEGRLYREIGRSKPPAPANEVAAVESPAAAAAAATANSDDPAHPDVARQLHSALGPSFSIFLPAVQQDLKLSPDQKRMLQQFMNSAFHGFQQFMKQTEIVPANDRERLHQEFRREADKTISAALGNLLTADQRYRLRQIMLQQEGLFALANAEVAAELRFDGEQERQFLERIVQETQKRLETFQQKMQRELQQKAQETGNPEEVQKLAARLQREAAQIRKEQESKIEALLTEAQKAQWKAMLGKPLDLGL